MYAIKDSLFYACVLILLITPNLIPSYLGVSVDDVRRRESYWQHELDTFQPNGLNEREVPLF